MDSNRYETYLRKAAGEDIDISNMPEPSDRYEYYLKQIAEGSNVDPEVIAEAVSDWLDDHPEATTTVEDGSITKAKLDENLQETVDDVDELKSAISVLEPTATSADVGKALIAKTVADGKVTEYEFGEAGGGVSAYVTPQMFGAKGDGETDDTSAIDDCIAYALEHDKPVYLPAGTYIKTASTYDIADGQSLVIYGDGQNSIIKRKPDSLISDWQRLFQIRINPTSAPAHDVIFTNFCIDSNRRNQSQATSGYDHEASADITLMNGTGASDSNYLDRFIVSGMRFYDPVADCVNISGSGQVYVKRVFLQNVVATGRQGTRNDIGITGNPIGPVFISGCDCGTIHFEYNQTPTDAQVVEYIISGCVFDTISLAAKIDLKIANTIANEGFLIGGFTAANISDCDIAIKGAPYTVMSSQGVCKFDNCRFRIFNNSDDSNNIYTFYVRSSTKAIIHNCDFVFADELTQDIDGDTNNDHAKGPAIKVEQITANVLIDNCEFDERLEYAVMYNYNNITIRNTVFETLYAIKGQSPFTSESAGHLEVDNVKLTDKSKGLIHGGNLSNSIELNGCAKVSSSNFAFRRVDITYLKTWFTKMVGDFHRVTSVSSPLDYTSIKSIAGYGTGNRTVLLYKGDEFVYAGSNPQCYPKKWVVRDTGETAYNSSNVVTTGDPLEERLISIGNGYGTTAQRPVCYLSKGWQYYDTDLAKTIMWDGSGWKNLDGTALT